MFFLRMITRSFTRQLRRRLLIALTVCLSATVSVSMLGVDRKSTRLNSSHT